MFEIFIPFDIDNQELVRTTKQKTERELQLNVYFCVCDHIKVLFHPKKIFRYMKMTLKILSLLLFVSILR